MEDGLDSARQAGASPGGGDVDGVAPRQGTRDPPIRGIGRAQVVAHATNYTLIMLGVGSA
jgi:hypothetical protein